MQQQLNVRRLLLLTYAFLLCACSKNNLPEECTELPDLMQQFIATTQKMAEQSQESISNSTDDPEIQAIIESSFGEIFNEQQQALEQQQAQWKALAKEEEKRLAQLEKDWPNMSDAQKAQARLLSAI